jgi:ElaB/YqjD/DUF883 family membrane-anchored ribosome-binding protein
VTVVHPDMRVERAKQEAEQARRRLASTLASLQQKLSPTAWINQAWSEVRERSGDFADDAVQAVKSRPVAASGVVAAALLLLARNPLRALVSKLFGGGSEDEDDGTITADLDDKDGNFDLTAPTLGQ